MKKIFLFIFLLIGLLLGQDKVANFALGTLATGINADTTRLTLVAGQGARFPTTGNYNLVIWDYSSYGWDISRAYYNAKAEIVRVTANSANVLTIVRGQEGTTARAFNASGHSYYAQLGLPTVTSKWLSDINDSITVFRGVLNASTEVILLDSISAHRIAINKNIDSVTAHRTALNNHTDSILAHRTAINKNIDSIAVLPRAFNPATELIMYDDFLFGIEASGVLNSTYYWNGSGVTIGSYSGSLYGTYGTSMNISSTNKVFTMSNQTSNTEIGIRFNTPNINTHFRSIHVNEGSGTAVKHFGYYLNPATQNTTKCIEFRKKGTSGNILCVTKNTDSTVTDTGISWGADVYKTLGIQTNATGDTVKFYVNNVLVASHNLNIPTDPLRFAIGNIYTGAGTSGMVYIDWFYLRITGLNR